MKKLTLMPPERTAALQSLWEDQATTDLGPCGNVIIKNILHTTTTKNITEIPSITVDFLSSSPSFSRRWFLPHVLVSLRPAGSAVQRGGAVG